MNQTVAAYQPRYFPRLHYLARVQQADVFVIYDDIEFSRCSRQHRALIDYDDRNWLTVPVRHTSTDVRIDEARIDMSSPWPVRHIKTLRGKYGAAADEWKPTYERLCVSPVAVETLRKRRDEVARHVGPELVDECLRFDDELCARRQESQLRDLRERKNRLARQVANRKRTDPNADVADLIARSETVKEELAAAETACRRLRRQRDQLLVDIGASLDGEADFERLSMARLWELEGVAPGELMVDVRLVDLTIPILLELFDRFDIESSVVRSSELPVAHPGDPSEYLARLTDYLGGDRYLTGEVGYENYLDETPFRERGQEVAVQDWSPTWVDGNVCALDVLYEAENPSAYLNY
ncbi:Seryl-tRNA synthetase, class IIa-like protein [Haloterrigena turkmenica DSM 5511]|uniref:Seryl-tRNA synthetase, class IIa-like protein n=1 Tax=Haloterrigena turkmenica (strain ATCC 51198 / DSM 5511 / JCM 9101 / NCIMB 13204 / VKM B-1734 / 4k) TaxID=543526 RepID=D2RTV4_HALTV|nr:WbqC family protein [Haloterrigena turkmenica]ADB61055.1 Seryl-tRNA synthetase, class IIa-like protein [Haloterrigena turkmenica DSM 5511]